MNKTSNITRLGEFIQFFQAPTLDEAIKAAEDWAQINNCQLSGNYYLQVRLGKSESIIVDLKPIADRNI